MTDDEPHVNESVTDESADAENSGESADDELSLEKLSEAFASAMGKDSKRESDATESDQTESQHSDPEAPSDTEPATAAEQSSKGPARKTDSQRNRNRKAAGVARPEEDEQPEDGVPISPISVLEAILFVGHPENEPMTGKLLASLMRGVSPNEVEQLVGELNARYEEDNAPYQIIREGDGYRLQLRNEFEAVRDRFYGRVRRARLSQAAIDVLAIVAYQQPVGTEEVNQLRGRPSGSILRQLVRRQLIALERIVENKKQHTQYRTTDRFLQLFQLDSLDELPQSLDSPG